MKLMICNQVNKTERKVLIAGGTGFIGKRVTELLSKNNIKCYVLSRNIKESCNNITYIEMDLKDLTEENCRIINENYGPFDSGIYLAANIPKIGDRKENYLDANYSTLIPSINFMEGFAQYVNKIIYASSIDAIGVPDNTYYDEMVETNPSTPYGVAKLCGENYLKSIASKYNINFVILRFSQVYGPFEPVVRIIPILLNSVKKDGVFSLYGEGKEKRRFLYVDDAAASVLCALDKDVNGIFNIAGKSIENISELIEITQKVYNKTLSIRKNESSAFVYDNIPSIEKAEKLLSFKPSYSLSDGIQKIFEEETNEYR